MNFGHPNPNRNSLHVCSPRNYLSLFSGSVFQCVSSSEQHGSAPNNNSDDSINIIKRIWCCFSTCPCFWSYSRKTPLSFSACVKRASTPINVHTSCWCTIPTVITHYRCALDVIIIDAYEIRVCTECSQQFKLWIRCRLMGFREHCDRLQSSKNISTQHIIQNLLTVEGTYRCTIILGGIHWHVLYQPCGSVAR